MKIRISEDFLEKLKAASQFAWKNMSNGSSYVKLDARDKKISLYSATHEASIEITVFGNIEEEGEAYIDVKAIPSIALLFNSKEDEYFDFCEEESGYGFYNSNEQRKLLIRKLTEGTSIPVMDVYSDAQSSISFIADDFREALSLISELASEVATSVHNAVLLDVWKEENKAKTLLVATDGKRLGEYLVDSFKPSKDIGTEHKKVVLPNSATTKVLKALPKDARIFKSTFSPSAVTLEADEYKAIIKPLDMKFVNYESIVERAGEPLCSVCVAELKEAAKRAFAVATERNQTTFFNLGKKTITVSGSSEEIGEIEVSVECTYDKEDLPFKLYYKYLPNLLDKVRDVDIQIAYVKGKPLCLMSKKWKYLIMPMD